MVGERLREMNTGATQAWGGTIEKAGEVLTLTSDVNRDISGRSIELSVAMARAGVQYLGEMQAALGHASEEARQLWSRQWEVVQEVSKDVMAPAQKAVALSGEWGGQITRLADHQRQALTRFTGSVQHLLEKAGQEHREAVTKCSEKILTLYGLKD